VACLFIIIDIPCQVDIGSATAFAWLLHQVSKKCLFKWF